MEFISLLDLQATHLYLLIGIFIHLGEDADIGGINVYNDNTLVESKDNGISQESTAGTGDVVLGRRFTNDDNYYTSAQVDELMFFNRNLSASEMETFYNLYQ